MHEDLYEAEQIPKPGGCILKLKEQNEVQQHDCLRLLDTQPMYIDRIRADESQGQAGTVRILNSGLTCSWDLGPGISCIYILNCKN